MDAAQVGAVRQRLAVREQDVGVTVAVHVFGQNRHRPADGAQRLEAPIRRIAAVAVRVQDAEGGVVLAAGHDFDAPVAVQVDGLREHVRHARDPDAIAEHGMAPSRGGVAMRFGRSEEQMDGTVAPFGQADEIPVSITVDIRDRRVFDAGRGPQRQHRPRRLRAFWARIEIQPGNAFLLEADRGIRQAIAVHVRQTDAVRAGTGADLMSWPGRTACVRRIVRRRQGEGKQKGGKRVHGEAPPWHENGGESGIRTHGRLAPTAVFKTAALNRSAISPGASF